MKKKKILIIDDEQINSQELRLRLTKRGYEVTESAVSVKQAHKILETVIPDLILMDIDLHDEIDGIELAAQIKQKHEIPIIYVSGIYDYELLQRLKKTEPYAFLSKPVKQEELIIAIEIALYKNKIDKKIKKEKEILEKENLKKEKFFSIISHDIKNPVSAVISFSNLLADNYDNYDDEKRKYLLNYLTESSNSLDNLMSKIVRWIKSQRNTFVINTEKLDLKEITNISINISNIKATQKEITIINNIKDNTIAFADKKHVEYIIRNFILNAIKYSYKQSSVEINCTNLKNYVQLSVIDKGVGISDYSLTRLFDISEKTKKYGTEEESGTGLSLIICKEYIEKNNGKIWAESTINKGSSFHITIPKENNKNEFNK